MTHHSVWLMNPFLCVSCMELQRYLHPLNMFFLEVLLSRGLIVLSIFFNLIYLLPSNFFQYLNLQYYSIPSKLYIINPLIPNTNIQTPYYFTNLHKVELEIAMRDCDLGNILSMIKR